ncbi:hypothetical protein DPMN_080653 [Dreissena polymorpha]|uniref:Uncharacterized protein n=1 Tax=Dreissena polymorpha TaxID=45954 RepID=A0A9D3YT52_DREPO|nr:hypothetical protein DPMN_080653 [Dreissena polymorpha]
MSQRMQKRVSDGGGERKRLGGREAEKEDVTEGAKKTRRRAWSEDNKATAWSEENKAAVILRRQQGGGVERRKQGGGHGAKKGGTHGEKTA